MLDCFAFFDTADSFSLFNTLLAPGQEFEPRKLSGPVNVEALTLQVLAELDDTFPEFETSENFDMDCLEPTPISPSICSSSLNVAKKRGVLADTQLSTEQPSKKQRCISPAEISFEDPKPASRFRDYQAEQWTEKYEELCAFVKRAGHCQVPHGFPENVSLSRWTKRQRYQYKLKADRKPSTMTDDRIVALNALGFVWNSHGAVWEERMGELQQYQRVHGHCNVPSQCDDNQKLATWVKCQRRQYKLFTAGERSNMTVSRVDTLQRMRFVWEIRCHGSK